MNKVIGRAYGAFGDGLHLVLTIAGIVLLASAVLATTVPNRLRVSAEEADERQNGQELARSAATAS